MDKLPHYTPAMAIVDAFVEEYKGDEYGLTPKLIALQTSLNISTVQKVLKSIGRGYLVRSYEHHTVSIFEGDEPQPDYVKASGLFVLTETVNGQRGHVPVASLNYSLATALRYLEAREGYWRNQGFTKRFRLIENPCISEFDLETEFVRLEIIPYE